MTMHDRHPRDLKRRAFLTGGMERMAFWLIETFPALATLG